MQKAQVIAGAIIFGLIVVALAGSRMFVSVPAGHVAVATFFGEVVNTPFREGLHFPVNPLYSWYYYDARQRTIKEEAEVPSQDQLKTKMDVSVIFRVNGNMAPQILQETGDARQVVEVHLVPRLRSVLREQGKSIQRAEDFFLEDTQERLQSALEDGLVEIESQGIEIINVLIRDITLPASLQRQIELKKEREQEVEKQKAELERFRTEQQQLIAAAEAEKEAATLEAERRRLIADAQAYEINALNDAIADNPAYVQLQALEALKSISKDPSSKIYFMDGNSSSPLPLMNIGDPLITGK